ncbi:MAG: class I SAM-dependent RNA methyltransferase [Cyanobacteriota bacterium]|nr:class I SAM-dependent RNA methyltransferase [Cyanobacteriota bacterium]
MAETFNSIAVVPPGLEEAAATELAALGAKAPKALRRAVGFQCDPATYYRLHLRARLPFRILRELARFPCSSRDSLYDGIQRCLDWGRWLPPERSFRVDASGSAPGLNHSHYSALQVKNALVDWQRSHWGARSSIDLDTPDLSLHLHLGGGLACLSVDGAGASLHRRGYRPRMGLAPLKENLAAGLIRLTGWDGRIPLADPLCGSGTLLIEAAAMALGRAPGLETSGSPRPLALLQWCDFEPRLWQQELEAARAAGRSTLADGEPLATICGSDADPSVVAQAQENAEAAGVAPWLQLQSRNCRDFVPPPGPGVMVCNPPYGERLGADDDLELLYSDLGTMVKERCSGWTLWLLSGNPELTRALRMKASRKVPVSNGGIDCRWLRYDIR